VTHSGALRSKNVGTSNHKQGEKPCRRKNKVSLATIVVEGLVGPKEMARAASDGQQVNIPALSQQVMEGRRLVCIAHYGFDVRALRRFVR
jgi:hypothetical protein